VAGVAAGLQVPAQVVEAECTGAFLQAPIAAAIDRKSAPKDQPTRCFCWLWVCPCVAGPAWDHDRQMPVDQRLCTAIALAEVTATGRASTGHVWRNRLRYPPTSNFALRDGVASERSQLPGGSTG
jgi:hypothetical protein